VVLTFAWPGSGLKFLDEAGQTVFRQVPQPSPQDLRTLVEHIAERMALTSRHVAMSWARRPKRVFGSEEPEVIAKIIAYLEKTAPDQYQPELPLGARAPPRQAAPRSG
jgi:hypothetical protein